MAANKLSSQDKKDLEKFTKYLVYKCIQIIVQSRLGEKKKSQSKPFSSGSDWFNLAIKDLPEVLAETKKVYTTSTLLYTKNINVEISLKTSEGENMTLEAWSMSMNTDQTDPGARVSYTVYNRMSVLLKSLLCVSRVSPGYKLSRNQGSETYVVCYRIYTGEPVTSCLGDGYSKKRVGVVPTPSGTITLSLAYRTKIMFSPHQSTKDLSIDLKDDHFKSDATSPKRGETPRPCKTAFRRHSSATPDDAPLGESEFCATSFSTSPTSPFGTFVGQSPPRMRRKSSSGDSCKRCSNASDEQNGEIPPENKASLSKGLKAGAFASGSTITEQPKGSVEDDIPFSSLLPQPGTDSNANKQVTIVTEPTTKQVAIVTESAKQENGVLPDNAVMNRRLRHVSGESNKSTGSQQSAPEQDFVMVELKTPFAGPEGNSELGRFYRDCQVAPSLRLFENNSSSSQEVINSITDQLSLFEANATDFDDFIDALQVEEG